MLSLTAYRILHLLGGFLLMAAVGGYCALALDPERPARPGDRRLLGMAHGVALVLIAVAGFGMLARLGVSWGWPAWIWLKLALWAALGASPVVVRKAPRAAGLLLALLPLLAATAAWLAFQKPGT